MASFSSLTLNLKFFFQNLFFFSEFSHACFHNYIFYYNDGKGSEECVLKSDVAVILFVIVDENPRMVGNGARFSHTDYAGNLLWLEMIYHSLTQDNDSHFVHTYL